MRGREEEDEVGGELTQEQVEDPMYASGDGQSGFCKSFPQQGLELWPLQDQAGDEQSTTMWRRQRKHLQ